MIPEGITLTVGPNESQFQLARRAFILIARQVSLPPSEQIAFAETFVPLRLNNPSFQLAWVGGSDPSPDDNTAVKPGEFNRTRSTQVTLTLTPEQKVYLTQRVSSIASSRPLADTLFSINGLSSQSGGNFGNLFPSNGNVSGLTEVKNVVVGEELRSALRLLETEALNFSIRFINDARVRQDYLRQTKEVAEEILASFMRGEMTEREAAMRAYNLRNGIMTAARMRSSDVGRAIAETKKLTPPPFEYFEDKYAKKFYNKPFAELTRVQQNRVWIEIVESSARPNAPVTAQTVRLNRLGKGLLVLSIGISVYNIATADDKVRATAKEGTTLLGGIAGGAAGGAVAGLACGPGAPVCVTLGVFIGGIVGALATDYAFDAAW